MYCDETTVQILQEPRKSSVSKSYMWVRAGGPPTPIKLFRYADSRRGAVICALREGYQGHLQTDDHAGYHMACTENNITQLGCWAHVRRKFIVPKKVNSGKSRQAGDAMASVLQN